MAQKTELLPVTFMSFNVSSFKVCLSTDHIIRGWPFAFFIGLHIAEFQKDLVQWKVYTVYLQNKLPNCWTLLDSSGYLDD